MILSEALSIYFSQAEASREGWRDADDETWDKAEEVINSNRKSIFESLGIKNRLEFELEDVCHKIGFQYSMNKDSFDNELVKKRDWIQSILGNTVEVSGKE